MNFTAGIKQSVSQFIKITKRIWLINPRLAVLILISRILQALLPLGILYTIKTFIDIIAKGNAQFQTLLYPIAHFALLQIAIAFINQVSSYWENTFQQIVSDSFSDQIIGKSISIDYTHFEDPAFQNTLYLAQRQARYRINLLLPALYRTISTLMSLLFLLLFFLSLKAYFFIAIFILALPLTVNKWLQGKKTADLEYKLAPKERESSYLFQILTGLPWAKEVRTFLFGKSFQQEFSNIRSHIAKEKKTIQFNAFKSNFIAEIFEVIMISSVIVYLAHQSSLHVISIGLFILYIQGIQRLQSSSKTFLQSILQIFQMRHFLGDLITFFDLREPSSEQSILHSLNFQHLTIENVSFRYPNSQINVIENVNIEVKKGEVIAIVGENGSGKSTLVKLLAGIYRPTNGSIRIDEVDINSIQKKEYHQETAFLFQDYEKYYMEADKNIHFEISPSEHVSRKAQYAAEQSEAHEFLKKLSSGYKTKLGNLYEGSEELSGGQWQKVVLARIFYKNAKLVVLDEPSSALDAFSELNLYDKIKTVFKDRIVIIISHRLYNLKIADRIYVMANGEIKQKGKFNELIEEPGIFKSLFDNQKVY